MKQSIKSPSIFLKIRSVSVGFSLNHACLYVYISIFCHFFWAIKINMQYWATLDLAEYFLPGPGFMPAASWIELHSEVINSQNESIACLTLNQYWKCLFAVSALLMIVFSKWQAELYHEIHVSGYRWSVSWTRDLERGEGSTSAKASFFFTGVWHFCSCLWWYRGE